MRLSAALVALGAAGILGGAYLVSWMAFGVSLAVVGAVIMAVGLVRDDGREAGQPERLESARERWRRQA